MNFNYENYRFAHVEIIANNTNSCKANKENFFINQTLINDYCTTSRLAAMNSRFEGNVEAHQGIKLNKVIGIKDVTCSRGFIKVKDSQLNNVKARDGINLFDTSASHIEVSLGSLSWINNKMIQYSAQSIEACDGILLKGVSCLGKTTSPMGKIKAENCILEGVIAREEIHLINSVAKIVKVRMGNLKIKHYDLEKASFKKLFASKEIALQTVTVAKKVICSMGKIKARNCKLHHLKARDGISLINTSATSCQVDMGQLSIIATETPFSYQSIDARDDIGIRNIKVEQLLKSHYGEIHAMKCILSAVEVYYSIEMLESTASSVLLKAHYGKGFCTFTDSIIEGDLIVKENAIQSRSIFGKRSTSASSLQETNEIKLVIKGGIIKGNIIFRGCKGKVTLLEGAEVKGCLN